MSRKSKCEDKDQLSLFDESEPDWIHADVDLELRGVRSLTGTDVTAKSEIEEAQDEDLEQFAAWLKQKR